MYIEYAGDVVSIKNKKKPRLVIFLLYCILVNVAKLNVCVKKRERAVCRLSHHAPALDTFFKCHSTGVCVFSVFLRLSFSYSFIISWRPFCIHIRPAFRLNKSKRFHRVQFLFPSGRYNPTHPAQWHLWNIYDISPPMLDLIHTSRKSPFYWFLFFSWIPVFTTESVVQYRRIL